MFQISLKNNKTFQCSENDTLIESARKAGIILEHGYLSGRCSSCKEMVDLLIGDPTIAKTKLGWECKYDLQPLVKEIMQSDIIFM
jgi:hypothetical protein